MINKIHIEKVATYVSDVEFNPRKISFIYGANGTGKSTLSKVLNDEISYPMCSIKWDTGTKEEVVVYNRDFVEKNFQTDTKLKGIFSLGEESIEIQKEIEKKRGKIDEIEDKRIKAQNSIDRINGEQDGLRHTIEQQCWNVQKCMGQNLQMR